MPARSAIAQLPEELQAELNQRLIKQGFSGYVALSEWLKFNGFEISKSALQRHGSKFEARCAALKMATEQARAFAKEVPDDEGAVNDSIIRMMQEKLFNILVDLDVENIDKINVSSLTKAVAALSRATVNQKKWQIEMRDKIVKVVEDTARSQGMDDNQVRFWREKVLGVK